MLHCHTISYHCASIIADCSNTGQWKNNIFYLLSSLQRQHHHSTFLTTTDPSLHDGLSRLLGKSFRRSFGSAAGSSAAAEASAAGAVALRRRPARPARSRCGGGQRGGQRGRRGRAACRSAGRSQQPLLQRAGVQNRKRDDWNECFDWFGICCWDAFSRVYWWTKYVLSTDCFQTVLKMMKLVCTQYEHCTNNVHTMYIQSMYTT